MACLSHALGGSRELHQPNSFLRRINIMTTYELISLIVMVISALFVGISIFYLSVQIRLFISAHADNHDWNRRIETQHAIARIRELNTDALNEKFGYMNRKEIINLEEIKEAFKEDHSLQLLLHKLLNSYEGLAIGVFLWIYDEKIVKASRKGTMERDFLRFKQYIEYRRTQSGKFAWAKYEQLISKWDKEHLKGLDRDPTGNI